MELLQYWKVVQKSLWLILLILAVGVGITAYYTFKEPPQYQSTAQLLLNPYVQGDVVPSAKGKAAADLSESYTALMKTKSFAEAVVSRLSYKMSPSKVAGAISTDLVPKTLFYKISAVQDSPAKAQQLLSTTIQVFLETNAEQETAQQEKQTAADIYRAELRKSLDTKLQDVRGQIQTYQAEIRALEDEPPSKERNDYLLALRGGLIGLQQTEIATIDAILKVEQLTPTAISSTSALIVDPPEPGKQLPSKLTTNLGLAVVMSLLVGFAVAFLRDYLDYTIRSPEYLEKVIGLSPVTAIGRLRKSNRPWSAGNSKQKHSLSGHRLVTIEDSQSPASESFRMLRTNIQLLSPEKPLRSLVITSVQPKEGKSFTAANLAIVMAQAGNRVILVDTDLRRSSLHTLFELPNHIGFADLLASRTPNIASVIQAIPGVDNLAVITSGPLPQNPSELLNSQQAAQVMAQLAQQVDVVIYDTPPAGVAIDPVIMATRVDAVIMVINAGSTRREMVLRVKHSLQNIGVMAILPVLNRVRARDMQGYYYSQYYRYSSRRQGASAPLTVPTPNGRAPSAVEAEQLNKPRR